MSETMQDQLARLYQPPHPRTVAKAIDYVDPHGRRFIALSPFVVMGSVGQGGVDVSPRGGGPGFVKVDEAGRTLLMPDRPGNNRIDSLKNLADTGEVGLMFMIPGVDDIYRVNGRAELADEPALIQAFVEFGKPPRSVLRIAVREAFLHCPKALMRADLWGDSHRVDRATLPSLAEMVSDQIGLPKPTATHEEQVAHLRETL
ncbi:MSMEG_1061 family FMN-dependent PPOX-type flavoprotein [Phenylobacterium sp.]|uniref:MSMEG_1061 family FMN-dependent PPOX-type flavoprotein n=1 Tax=Phenylobacterium sp. TaxID=1871053 RepID=UPI002C83E353|nr:MSMEG_1061 family FMN-dependent PPOX-type flavoprotein [Phenylobacterium sp.]HVI33418.1 MSMEG_1061 family FMN-dependent PPOX-type flavoprotein [Phenylobacterium sp.]